MDYLYVGTHTTFVNTNYLDPKDINQGLEIMPISIAWHSIKLHLPIYLKYIPTSLDLVHAFTLD
jgi:hypothetical protein